MKWQKLGRIFSPQGESSLMHSHAQNPQAISLDDKTFRIFFSSRDSQNRSSIFSLDIDIHNPTQTFNLKKQPLLTFGAPGYFDDSGVTHGHLIQRNGFYWMYYLGWNLGVTVPWRNAIGLAKSKNLEGPFEKVSESAVLDRSSHDPFSLSYPFVTEKNGNWEMIYGSNLKWGSSKEDMHHVLKRATSSDGLHWQSTGETVLSIDEKNEIAVSRPWLMGNKMYFSYRKDIYRIGSAEKDSKGKWIRSANDEIQTTPGSWDSEMVCYPSLFEHGNSLYMLYCGNAYGKTGFGIAVAKT